MNMKRVSDDYSKAGITAKRSSDPDEATTSMRRPTK